VQAALGKQVQSRFCFYHNLNLLFSNKNRNQTTTTTKTNKPKPQESNNPKKKKKMGRDQHKQGDCSVILHIEHCLEIG